jgi:hypothetical protein
MIEKTTFEKYVGRAGIALGASSTFTHSETEIVDWMDNENPPTDEALNAKIVELQAEYDAQAYARNRASEYPSLLELTVALYDTDDKSAVEAKRAAVKAKYPKPE